MRLVEERESVKTGQMRKSEDMPNEEVCRQVKCVLWETKWKQRIKLDARGKSPFLNSTD